MALIIQCEQIVFHKNIQLEENNILKMFKQSNRVQYFLQNDTRAPESCYNTSGWRTGSIQTHMVNSDTVSTQQKLHYLLTDFLMFFWQMVINTLK